MIWNTLAVIVNLTLVALGYLLAWSVYARRMNELRRSRDLWRDAANQSNAETRRLEIDRWRQS